MEIVTPESVVERVGFLVPRWTTGDPRVERQGIPFRCFPVAGALFNHGYELVYFDQELDLDVEDRLDELRRELEGCRIVFLWTNELWPLTQYRNLGLLIGHLRSWYPGITLVVGGAFVNVCPPEMFYVDSPVDYFIRGSGEHVCPELIKALDGEARFDDLAGLVWRENGEHRHNPLDRRQRIHAENQEVLYRHLDLTRYVQRGGIFGNEQDTFIVGSAQGCAKGCTFCFWRNDLPSLLDPEGLVDLIAYLRDRYGVRQYHLAELDFFTNRSRPLTLARAWRERLPDCVWFSLVSPVDAMKFSDEELALLAEGGCKKLELGAESGSQPMLRTLGKRHTPEDVLALHRRLLDHGIYSLYNFIFGFWGETAGDRRASLEQIDALYGMSKAHVTFAFRLYQPTPNTPLGDKALEKAPDFPATIDGFQDYRPIFDSAGARSMPWLESDDERVVKKIVGYLLPIATSRFPVRSPLTGFLYRSLRRLAWLRLREGWWWGGLDERLYGWILGRTLSQTYRP